MDCNKIWNMYIRFMASDNSTNDNFLETKIIWIIWRRAIGYLVPFYQRFVSRNTYYAAPRTHCAYFIRICTISDDSMRVRRTGQLFIRPGTRMVGHGDECATARLSFYRSEDIGFINIVG